MSAGGDLKVHVGKVHLGDSAAKFPHYCEGCLKMYIRLLLGNFNHGTVGLVRSFIVGTTNQAHLNLN